MKIFDFIRVLIWNATHNREFPQAEIFTFFKVEFSARRFSLSVYFDPQEICEGLEWEIDGYNFCAETSRLGSAQEIHSWLEKKAQERYEQSRELLQRLRSRGVDQITFDTDGGEATLPVSLEEHFKQLASQGLNQATIDADGGEVTLSVSLEEQYMNVLGDEYYLA